MTDTPYCHFCGGRDGPFYPRACDVGAIHSISELVQVLGDPPKIHTLCERCHDREAGRDGLRRCPNQLSDEERALLALAR